jgi:hypothetical protein
MWQWRTVFLLTIPTPLSGQGVQAIRGIGEAGRQEAVDSAVKLVQARVAAYTLPAAVAAYTPSTNVAIEHARAAAEELLLARGDVDRFRDRLPAFIAADHQVHVVEQAELGILVRSNKYFDLTIGTDAQAAARSLLETNAMTTSGNIPIPAISTLVPQVAFTTAFGGAFASKHFAGGVGFNTNMAGAAIGSAFDALGSGSLKDYFTNNVAVGATIPTTAGGKISSDLGLGLGGVSIGRWTAWPVLGIGELDSADTRLRPELAQRKPNQSNWSQLTFGIGVPLVPVARAVTRIKCGKLVPILTVGAAIPYYFPGSSYTAIASVFSSRRNEFQNVGGASLLIGVDVPLLKVGSASDAAAGTTCSGL